MAFAWTDARVARAKQLYIIEGKSAAETADALGGDCTRNAVIGKAHRQGWMKEHRQKPTSLGKVRAPAVARVTFAKAPKPVPQGKVAVVFGGVKPVVTPRA